MNFKQLENALKIAIDTGITLNIVGRHGCGKTQFMHEYAKNNDMDIIMLRLGQVSDVADVAGLNYPTTIDSITKLKHLLPEYLPTTGKGILFLDEWNRCHPDLIQAIFQLFEGGLNGYKLPKDWHVMASMNPNTDDYTTIDFKDKALTSRICHIKIEPTTQEFLDYSKPKMDSLLHEFLTLHPEMIEGKVDSFVIDFCSPDRRGWLDKFNKVLTSYKKLNMDDEMMLIEMHQGISGLEAARTFKAWYDERSKFVSPDEILKDANKAITRLDLSNMELLSKLMDDCLEILKKRKNEKKFGEFTKFVLAIPADLSYTVTEKMLMDDDFYNRDEEMIKKYFLHNDEFNSKLGKCEVK